MSGLSLTVKQAENFLRLAFAQLVLVFFLLIHFISLPGFEGVKPHFFLMVLYYWAIYRPTIVPFFFCFGAGFFVDILAGGALGIHPLIFILVRWLVSNQRRFLMGQPYIAIWLGFALITLLSSSLLWVLYGIANNHWVSPVQPLISAGFTIFLFPPVTLLLVKVHRLLPVASRTVPRVE